MVISICIEEANAQYLVKSRAQNATSHWLLSIGMSYL